MTRKCADLNLQADPSIVDGLACFPTDKVGVYRAAQQSARVNLTMRSVSSKEERRLCNPQTMERYRHRAFHFGDYVDQNKDYFTAKQDNGKPMFRLIPLHLLAGVAKVREYGVKKYKQEHSWKDVPDARNRYTDALFRHLFAWLRGEKYDPESGLRHIDHACCNLIFLMQFEEDK